MRISFLGKGGSGKTTVSAAFIKYLKNTQDQANILAIDADVNVHLGALLGIESQSIGGRKDDIKEYFEGSDHPVIGVSPPSRDSKFVTIDPNDQFLQEYATGDNRIKLLTVGSYEMEDVGSACYHGKLNSIELIYHRLLDGAQDFVVTDSTAGIDSVGTSLFFVSDINVFVVEPTNKSVKIFHDFEKISHKFKTNTLVIGNKIHDDTDIEFIEQSIGRDKIIGYVKNSTDIRRLEQGKTDVFGGFADENSELFEKLISMMRETKRDWPKYLSTLKSIYLASAEEWYNDFYGDDLAKYIDESFSYEEAERANS